MNDFRSTLYPVYVSRFQESRLSRSERAEGSFRAWAKRKYLPMLKGIQKDAAILELGCGAGYFMELLRESGYSQVEGVDICSEQIALALGRGLDVRRADVFEFLAESGRHYHVIAAFDFLEHFTRDELNRLLPMVALSLHPGGRLLVSTPNGQGLMAGAVIFGDFTHLTVFTPAALTQLLKANGFSEVHCAEAGPAAKNLAGVLRVSLWNGIRLVAGAARFVQTGKWQKIWTETFLCVAFKDKVAPCSEVKAPQCTALKKTGPHGP